MRIVEPKASIMKKFLYSAAIVCMFSGALFSCVSKKKYTASLNANKSLQATNLDLHNKLTNANKSVDDLQKEVTLLSSYYSDANTQLKMSAEEIKAQQERVRMLQQYLDGQRRTTEALRKKVADALVGFNSEDLAVYVKNGKVYVSLQERLLFPSGSAVVNETGKTAIAKLSAELKQNPDINVEVEGHTDNKPIKTSKYPDNWALSVGRSTAIVRLMVNDFGVPADRVIASGRGEYRPVASNDSDNGRALNRRTEIILEPKLDELMKLIGTPPAVTKQ